MAVAQHDTKIDVDRRTKRDSVSEAFKEIFSDPNGDFDELGPPSVERCTKPRCKFQPKSDGVGLLVVVLGVVAAVIAWQSFLNSESQALQGQWQGLTVLW